MSIMTNQEFSALVANYERLVYTVCYRLVQNDTSAEDLTQETFLAAYTHRDSCPAGFEKQWLARIAANKAKDHLQSAYSRHTLLPGDESIPPGLSPPAEEQAVSNSETAAITEIIQNLREPYRQVCILHFLQERSPEETALCLGRPVKTVRTQISRGKLQIQEQWNRRSSNGSV